MAIIGAGPAGMSAAYYLRIKGYPVTVFEKEEKPGGMLRYGIPNYRLPKERLDDDIRAILKTGVQVKNGLKIGQDITIQELRQQYDANIAAANGSSLEEFGFGTEFVDESKSKKPTNKLDSYNIDTEIKDINDMPICGSM